MNLSWKLLPLAAVAALGVAVLLPGGVTTPTGASANINSFSVTDTDLSSGDTTTVNVDADDGPGDLEVWVSGVGGSSTADFEITDCNGCDEEGDTGDDLLIDTTDSNFPSNGQIELELTVTCENADAMVVHVLHDGDEQTQNISCAPGGNITISKDAPDADSRDFDFSISGDSSCDQDFSLADGESQEFACDYGSETYTITEDVPAGWALDDIQCSDDNISSGDINIDVENASVEVNLDDADQALDCTFYNVFAGTATPGTAGSVTLTVSTNSPPCNLPVVVIATVRDDNQLLLSGVDVEFSAPKGTFTITSGQTAAGVLSTLYTGPSTGSEPIVLTATAGGKTGTTTITTNCAEASPTATATTVVPTATTGGIQPPNTGDAGLKSDGGSNTYVALGAFLAVISTAFVGTVVVARRGS
jgi:hypothetical protein